MPNESLLMLRVKTCLLKAKPELGTLQDLDESQHIHFDYGLDSLGYEKFIYLLEEEFGVHLDPDIHRSGYFSSLSGVCTMLKEEFGIAESN